MTDINSSWSLQNYRDRARRWGIQVPWWWGTQIMWDVVVLCALGNKPSDEGAKTLNPSLHVPQHIVLAWWLDELQESALAKSATSFCFWTACLVCKCLCWPFHIVGDCSHCPSRSSTWPTARSNSWSAHKAFWNIRFSCSIQDVWDLDVQCALWEQAGRHRSQDT